MSRREPPRIYAAEQLALRLEQQIVERALGPGDRLGTKAEIAARFGYSGGTVNEALILLETRGMLEARPGPGGGIFAASPLARVRLDRLLRELHAGSPDPAECRAVRAALEPSLCLDAARLCAEADAADLREILAAMAGADPPAAANLIWALHRRIAQICANTLLGTLYLTVLDCAEEGAEPAASAPPGALAAHDELVEALVAGDRPRLRRALEGHAPLCLQCPELDSNQRPIP